MRQFKPDTELPTVYAWWIIDLATPTDFRQSPLRIDLDGDNSSGHITAGYYDTLTTCVKEAPVVDEDVELYTCGSPGTSGKVDFISFRLKYFDQPRLPSEEIYSVDFPDQLTQTAPDRYVWQNPYEYDEIKIREFLRSLRYRADWDPADADQSRERVVAVTMHVDGDSTSSWTVYQLEQSEVYAGRDTTVEYCTEQVSLDLRSYLSAGVDPDAGTFSPEPSGGGSLFVPGTDEDGEYLYIIAWEECQDTAVITLSEVGRGHLGLDSVLLCPGESRRIGFPPGKYSSITWWDGSTGDSILVSETVDVQRHVEVVFQRCTIYMQVEIIVRSATGLAGRDSMITYCPGSGPIALSLGNPPQGGSSRIVPALSVGGLVFTPGTDAPGEYRYIVSTDAVHSGCADTALITFEESTTTSLTLDPVTLCAGEELRIGLPSGVYDEVSWWNGDTGDSTTIVAGQSGPFSVEARLDGCTYEGEVMVSQAMEVVIPDVFPDTWTLCAGTPESIPVNGLDSVLWADRIYLTGEEIPITTAGEILLRGFQGGCWAEKNITVTEVQDPASDYRQTISWCPPGSVTLTLPEDDAQRQFYWADGTPSPERTVDSAGSYPFTIQSDQCTFTSAIEVIEDTNCESTECTLSIPNAVSPNGDGINDDLRIYAPGCNPENIQGLSARLLDKWGRVLYRTSAPPNATSLLIPAEAWQDLAPGVYALAVEYEDGRGRLKSEWGTVTVVR